MGSGLPHLGNEQMAQILLTVLHLISFKNSGASNCHSAQATEQLQSWKSS